MRSNLNFFLGIAICISGYSVYKSYKARPQAIAVMELQNTDLSKAVVPSSEPTLYVLWTTWCPACSNMLSQEFLKDPRIQSRVVLVNDGEETELVLSTLKQRGYPFKSLLDPNRNFARAVKANSYPSFYIQNKNGKISKFDFGMVYRPSQIVDEWLTKLYQD